ncbi:MAG: CARDB domain-containing protein, partial [Candidatus Latescibacterota bacterium]
FNWYWGKDVPVKPYVSKPLDQVTRELRLYASVWDDFAFYRFTEAGVHRDDYRTYGSNAVYSFLLGGSKGARTDAHPNFAVTWPSGGGPDVARVMLQGDDTSLRALCYSFDTVKRDLQMRLCRIQDGRYRVGLYSVPDDSGNAGAALWEKVADLRRFDVVNLPVPPRTRLLIKVEQLESRNRPGELPDLAVDPWDAVRAGSQIKITVHNLGNGAANNVAVRLLDGDKTLQEKRIDSLAAPVDFKPKRVTVTFPDVPASRNLRVLLDPGNTIPEILEVNNEAAVK